MRFRLRHRPGLVVALAVLVVASALATRIPDFTLRAALLLGWCAGAATHVVQLLRHLALTPAEAMRHHAEQLEDSRWTITLVTLAAALAALVGVVGEIGGAPRAGYSLALGIAAIVLSWVYLHVLFAAHYAHVYALSKGGLEFPGGLEPDWMEFLYLAFTIGMTAQVSDVTTSSPAMRRMVLAHALASFAFNAAILGVAVNLLAGSAAG
ncbi:DUF1345 domain-containing protein [Neoroseomonas oryzicola]|uniref:DUF1345 domain-containing protein n=1 Tax=Neoroseomonas oryzicola TaxID=535904 RepID=A0A9X9WI64_9PROT|nr:DUF1345 domain-containing protein [Neoroseomonas oryzicola]MBR0660024.1 DUF1345 domain-containing protein [Neoroseomonas oryzicola]NKE19423.1 DUF1345 domain-containing protein [Neoroseomonas oryzicola]